MPRKLIYLILSMVLVLSIPALAGALTLTDTTMFNENGTAPGGDLVSYGGESVSRLEHMGDWVTWTHHYTFDPEAAAILSGRLTLTFSDDDADYMFDIGINTLADGEFTIKLASLLGDFSIDKSILEIDYEPAASVPEPATLMLTGLGLIGAGIARRKLKR